MFAYEIPKPNPPNQVPIFDAPLTKPHDVPGYLGGKLNPEKRGATYFVCPEGGDPVFETNNKDAKWYFSALARKHRKKIGEAGVFKLGCDAKGKDKTKFEFGDRSVPQKFFRERISAVDEVFVMISVMRYS